MLSPNLGPWLVVGVAVGLLGGLVMDGLMARQEDGFAPARVAAAVFTGRSPVAVPFRDAVIVHHVASGVIGGVYAALSLALAAVSPVEWTLGGVRVVPHVLAVAAVVGFIYLFFTAIVLPRVDDAVYEEDATAIHGRWLRAAALFGAVMLVGVPAVVAAFG